MIDTHLRRIIEELEIHLGQGILSFVLISSLWTRESPYELTSTGQLNLSFGVEARVRPVKLNTKVLLLKPFEV